MRHHHYPTTALALLFGLGVAATGTPAAAQGAGAAEICDRNEDGFIDSQESWVCADARFDEASGGGEYITEGRHFINLYPGEDDAIGLYDEIDADQDRQISRDEYRAWYEGRFAAATEATGGRMAVADYERFERGEELAAAGTAGELGLEDVVAQLRDSGNFSTFVRAIEAAGLVEELKDAGPFTVFAPTDEAFAKLPPGTVEALLADKEKLTAILTYHVVPGRIPASAVLKAGRANPATVQGQMLDVRVVDGTVRVDGAKVIMPDIAASNGVIHVIDTVILPKEVPAAAAVR